VERPGATPDAEGWWDRYGHRVGPVGEHPEPRLGRDPDGPDRPAGPGSTGASEPAGASAELTGDNCPQQPTQGSHGARFAPKAGYWDLKPGEMVSVVFPVYSTTDLKGIAATPADCMVGSVWAAASLDVWDEPQVGDACPPPRTTASTRACSSRPTRRP
jgi:hypothetical protein